MLYAKLSNCHLSPDKQNLLSVLALINFCIHFQHYLALRGGGGGVQPDFLVKLVAQQTRTRDQTFKEVVNPNPPLVLTVQPHPYLIQFWINYTKSPKHAQKQYFGALPVW